MGKRGHIDNNKAAKRAPIGDVAKTAVVAHYAHCRNFNATAREYGLHPMKVKRLWDSLTEEERCSYENSAAEIKQVVTDEIQRQDVEWLRTQHEKMREVLLLGTNEILERLKDAKQKDSIKTKDLTGIVKAAYSICAQRDIDNDNIIPTADEQKKEATKNYFNQFNISISKPDNSNNNGTEQQQTTSED